MEPDPQLRAMPVGSKVFLPDQAERKRRAETRLLEVFGRWGFREIVTPAFDLYAARPGAEVRDAESFRLIDRETGGLLALRSDVTPQIARAAGTLLADRPRPLRLCYVTSVYRHAYVAGMLHREFWQAGVELIGLVSLEADAEMIAIAVECLRRNGVERFRVSLSHTAFVRGLLDALRLEEGQRAEVLDAIARRDASGVKGLLGRSAAKGPGRGLLELGGLFGGPEVLDRAEKLAGNAASKRAVRELRRVFGMLEWYGLSDRIVFDLSDFRDFDYYTGVIFEGFVEGSGYPVCGGGRYDRLLGLYGIDGLGTGFAFDVDQLLQVMPEEESPSGRADFLVIDFTTQKRLGIRLARELRSKGWRVARDIIRRGLPDSLAYARSAGIPRCLVVAPNGAKGERVRLLDASGRELGRFSASELDARVGAPEAAS